MQNITVIAVGKIKEKYFADAILEYLKRLGRYCNLNIVEVKDEPTPDNPTEREKAMVLEKEGAKIAEKIPKSGCVVALCIEGREYDSVGFSDFIEKASIEGGGNITFIIGGSMGISEEIKRRANYKISFSRMTFPHQLMRVILLEQTYRAFNISNGGKYHK